MDTTSDNIGANENWSIAQETVRALLGQHGGCVGTRTVRKRLQAKGVENISEVIAKLKFHFEDDREAPFYHHGRSFYAPEAFEHLRAATESAAATAEADSERAEVDAKEESNYVANKREEARLGQYVRRCLEDLYGTDFSPEENECVFDVHNARPGNEFENVDLVAVHWRSEEIVELVSVEVKLGFGARLVQQANNYKRFSDRVWIAVTVEGHLSDAALELREIDGLLFEHVVDSGLGILACRRTRGSAYDVLPVHWPRKCHIDQLERVEFLERHRGVFEAAGVIAPQHYDRFPRVR